MKLIIDIPEEAYNGIKMGMRNRDDMREIGEAIENGIPLKDEVMIATLMSLVNDKDYKPNLEGKSE